MKHRVAGRKLGRTTEHRVALMRNLSTALFEKERIRTTLAKAKELRPFAEKLLTLSKKETLHARRLVLRHIHDRGVVAKMFDALSARYAQRPGGYTRIIKLGPRRGDNAEMAIIELVGVEGEKEPKAAKGKGGTRGKRKAKAPAKQAAEPAAAEASAEAADDAPKKAASRKKTPSKKASSKKAASKKTASKKKAAKKAAKKDDD